MFVFVVLLLTTISTISANEELRTLNNTGSESNKTYYDLVTSSEEDRSENSQENYNIFLTDDKKTEESIPNKGEEATTNQYGKHTSKSETNLEQPKESTTTIQILETSTKKSKNLPKNVTINATKSSEIKNGSGDITSDIHKVKSSNLTSNSKEVKTSNMKSNAVLTTLNIVNTSSEMNIELQHTTYSMNHGNKNRNIHNIEKTNSTTNRQQDHEMYHTNIFVTTTEPSRTASKTNLYRGDTTTSKPNTTMQISGQAHRALNNTGSESNETYYDLVTSSEEDRSENSQENYNIFSTDDRKTGESIQNNGKEATNPYGKRTSKSQTNLEQSKGSTATIHILEASIIKSKNLPKNVTINPTKPSEINNGSGENSSDIHKVLLFINNVTSNSKQITTTNMKADTALPTLNITKTSSEMNTALTNHENRKRNIRNIEKTNSTTNKEKEYEMYHTNIFITTTEPSRTASKTNLYRGHTTTVKSNTTMQTSVQLIDKITPRDNTKGSPQKKNKKERGWAKLKKVLVASAAFVGVISLALYIITSVR